MKIGIITIMDYTNYGNRLQNYALYYFLKEKCNCEVMTLASYDFKVYYAGTDPSVYLVNLSLPQNENP